MTQVATMVAEGRELLRSKPIAVLLVLGAVLLLFNLVIQLASGVLEVSQFVTYVWDGLVVGLIIGLAGIGLSMTYSILNFANFFPR